MRVKSQEEFDAIPEDFCGVIYIYFGSTDDPAIVNKDFVHAKIVVRGNSSVVVSGTANVEAWDRSSVEARDCSLVEARDISSVSAFDIAIVIGYDHSKIKAFDYSRIGAENQSSVKAYNHSNIYAYGYSNIEAYDYAKIIAHGNTQTIDASHSHNIKISYADTHRSSEAIQEYCDFHDIETDTATGKGKFYKAVHKVNGIYFSDYDRKFRYKTGSVAKSNGFNVDVSVMRRGGIDISHADFALMSGWSWEDLAILELEVDLCSIVIPKDSINIRASEVKVLREVPLEEFRLYGEIITKLRGTI